MASLAQTPGDSEGQGCLECCSLWGCKESDTTERLNNSSRITDPGKELIGLGLGQLLMPGHVATLKKVVILIATMWMVGKGQFSQSSGGDVTGSATSSLMQAMWC